MLSAEPFGQRLLSFLLCWCFIMWNNHTSKAPPCINLQQTAVKTNLKGQHALANNEVIMQYKTISSPANKSIALVAHDNMKGKLIEWCIQYQDKLAPHQLFATGTTGKLIQRKTGLTIEALISGPLGGDQQIGALITEQKIDLMIFFWDPLQAQPHDPDVKALLRLAAVWNIPVACNQSTADLLINSALFSESYQRSIPDYQQYINQRTI